ncbi:hypothetical protein AB1N83_008038 [Pleurotus pulmonarius]
MRGGTQPRYYIGESGRKRRAWAIGGQSTKRMNMNLMRRPPEVIFISIYTDEPSLTERNAHLRRRVASIMSIRPDLYRSTADIPRTLFQQCAPPNTTRPDLKLPWLCLDPGGGCLLALGHAVQVGRMRSPRKTIRESIIRGFHGLTIYRSYACWGENAKSEHTLDC